MLSVHSLMQEAKVASRERSRLRRKEERKLVATGLDGLSETGRLVFGLRYYESVRPAQIAGALGLPEEEVRRVLAEALVRILEPRREKNGNGGAKDRPRRAGHESRRNGKGQPV